MIFRYFLLTIETDPKFDVDHEYVVLLGVTRIFTQLLTNLETGSRQKKATIKNLRSELCLRNTYHQLSQKKLPQKTVDKCLQGCAK